MAGGMTNQARTHIRVVMDGALPRFELINDGEKIRDVTYVEIVGMIMQFTSALRWR